MRASWTRVGAALGVPALLVAVATPVAAASSDVSVTVSASPGTATVGDTVTVTAHVTNGVAAVDGIDVRLEPDWGMVTVLSASVTGGSCTLDLEQLCTVGAVGAGQVVVATATYRLDEAGPVTLGASVYLPFDEDTDPSNDVAQTSVTALPVLPVLGLTASASQVGFGRGVTLTATVTAQGAPAPVGVRLYRRTLSDAAPVLVDEALPYNAGTVTFTDDPAEQVEYVARTVPEQSYAEAVSAPVVVRVAATVSTVVSPVALPPGGQVSVTARVQPAVAGGVVVVQERFGSGDWYTVATPLMGADGRISVGLGRRTKVGTYALRVTRPPDGRRVAGSAETRTVVTVTGTGRASAWAPLGGSKAQPSHWGTCSIGYRVNPRRMPAHGMSDLREAMRRATLVSGVRFRHLGSTGLVPYAGDGRAGRNRITVAWSTMAGTRGLLRPGIAGVGGSSHRGGRILTGFVVLNTAFSKAAPAGFGAGVPHGLVLMHELGHVLGLDHVNNRHQIMNPGTPEPAAVWGAGDLRGLRAMGRAGGCR